MNRRDFNQYLSECNFRELFIMEMGWNRFRGKADILPCSWGKYGENPSQPPLP